MIKFEFSLNKEQDTSRYSSDYIRNFTAQTFRGEQTFVIDDIDLSYKDVSILLFTRHIRFIWHWTGVGSSPYEMTFAKGEMPIKFTRIGDDVQIEKFKDDTYETVVSKAVVKAAELEQTIRKYFKMPFKACTEFYPALNEIGDKVDYISNLHCEVVRTLIDGKSYEVRIKEGGMLAELVCTFDLIPGEVVETIFGTTTGCYALLTLTDAELRKRKNAIK